MKNRFPATGSRACEQNDVLEKALCWLFARQDESGAFKSRHYGAMKQGAAMTSLALYAISLTPADCREKHTESINRAFEFLRTGTKARGRIANPDGSLDHPVYSTAMFLTAARRLDHDVDATLVGTLLVYLVRSQCVESRGFESGNPNYGGWDVIGPDVMPGKTAGTNVSVTHFVVEALASWRADPALAKETKLRLDNSIEHACRWLKRLQNQNPDGGFFFTAHPGSALNKSKSEKGQPKAYSTATCDGYLALQWLASDKPQDEVLRRLEQWIVRHVKTPRVAGFEENDPSGWSEALLFYHLQVLARVVDAERFRTGPGGLWAKQLRPEIALLLKESQHEDGRFENKSALMRENDPLIATSFAIMALSAIH